MRIRPAVTETASAIPVTVRLIELMHPVKADNDDDDDSAVMEFLANPIELGDKLNPIKVFSRLLAEMIAEGFEALEPIIEHLEGWDKDEEEKGEDADAPDAGVALFNIATIVGTQLMAGYIKQAGGWAAFLSMRSMSTESQMEFVGA